MMTISIHCDGSCIGNGTPEVTSGYGVVIVEEEEVRVISGKCSGMQSNNRAELKAMIVSLNEVLNYPVGTKVNIYSDSEIVTNGINGNSKRKANRDLWIQIEDVCKSLIELYDVTVTHCNKAKLNKDDDLYKYNVMADSLAYQKAHSLL